MGRIKFSLFFIVCVLPKVVMGEVLSKEAQSPPNIGNFALPDAQQPGPFLSFGQSIIGQNQVQIYGVPSYLRIKPEQYLSFYTSGVYGLSDKAAFLVTVPNAVKYDNDISKSNGLGDLYFQGEYAFYEKLNYRYDEQMSLVGGVTLPTGSINQDPSTGLGSVSYFLGGSYNRMSVNWLWFTSAGLTTISKHAGIELGNQYFYQMGVGRNIKSETGKFIFSGLLEVNGIYTNKNKFEGSVVPDSGGNLIYIAPSLWFSTQKLFLQLGVALPASQALNGEQRKINYNLLAAVGLSFNGSVTN